MLDSRQAGKFVFRFIIVADVILQQPAIAGHVRPLDGGGFPTAGNLAGLGIVGRRGAGNNVHLHGSGGDGRPRRNGGLPPGATGGVLCKSGDFGFYIFTNTKTHQKFNRGTILPLNGKTHPIVHAIFCSIHFNKVRHLIHSV